MTKFFLKKTTMTLTLNPSNLKVELALDIIIPNIYLKLYIKIQ